MKKLTGKWPIKWIYAAILGLCMVAMTMQHSGASAPEDCGADCAQNQNGG